MANQSSSEAGLKECLQVCALPIGSPRREAYFTQMLKRWSARSIWAMIGRHPGWFEWSVSIRGARLTGLGEEVLSNQNRQARADSADLERVSRLRTHS